MIFGWSKGQKIACFGFAALVCLGGLFLVIVQFPAGLPATAPGPRDSLSPAELALIQPGDIILRRGSGVVSDLIVNFLQDGSGLSHCAMVMECPANPAGSYLVVQSLSGSLSQTDGVQTQSIKDFNTHTLPRSLVVVRPRASASQKLGFIQAANRLLDQKIPFDIDFNLGDRGSLYCSELMAEIFEQIGWWPQPVGGASPRYALVKAWLDFRSFLNPQYFELIISHNPAVTRL